jgi:hypothetical protein
MEIKKCANIVGDLKNGINFLSIDIITVELFFLMKFA